MLAIMRSPIPKEVFYCPRFTFSRFTHSHQVTMPSKLILHHAFARRVIVASLALCCCPASAAPSKKSASRNSKPARASTATGPSLRETVAWLKERINRDGGFRYTNPDDPLRYSYLTYKVTEISDSTLDFKLDLGSGDQIADVEIGTMRQLTVPLKQLSGAKVNYVCNKLVRDAVTFPVLYVVAIHPGGGRSPITANTLTYSRGKKAYESNQTPLGSSTENEAGFAFTDEALAKRVATALTHLLKLAGQKKEPF